MKKILLSLWLTVVVSVACAQQRTVTGKVSSSDDGSALPGVNVLEKGTTNGTVTDSNGQFSLSIPSNGGILVISFIGFQTQEIALGERTSIEVSLTTDVTQLSEVVVTALGVERETKTLGFSVKEIKNQELTVGRTTNVVNALSGKIAGVRVAGTNGMTGSASAIFIRGYT
ncbi:MAG: carboxypeptidase-like regulatory domain-containing protein, partial [Cyclobacteriaceae bacterium]